MIRKSLPFSPNSLRSWVSDCYFKKYFVLLEWESNHSLSYKRWK